MFYRKKAKTFTKSKNLSYFSLPIIFILTFLLIIFNKTDYLVVNKMKSVSTEFITPVSQFISLPIKFSSNVMTTINQMRTLKTENVRLQEEVKRLKKWQSLAIKNESENRAYKKLLNSTTNENKIVKTAYVISKSPKIYARTATINSGFDDGITENLVAINERGLVGKIISASKNNSKILLLNDQNLSVPVKTYKEDFFAIIKGTTNGNFLVSSFIKGEKKPKVGEILLTSGNGKTFPSNILVGKIIKVEKNSFFVLPYVDFDNLNYIQIIDNN